MKRNRSGIRLEPVSRKNLAAIRDGFNRGHASPTTLWRLPRSLQATGKVTGKRRRYAIVDEGRVVGTCGLWKGYFCGIELAIAIFEKTDRGRGIGTFVVRRLCDVAFRELHAHRVELGVWPDNTRAIRLYRKCGFKKELVLRRYMYHEGKWRDAMRMSLLRDEWEKLGRR